MPSLPIDAALNLLWLAISVSALVFFSRRGCRLRRFLAVGMMAVAIFPSVSDTDDIIHFSLLRIPTNRGGVGTVPTPEDSREKDNLHLARVLETLETYQTSGFYVIALALFCLGAMVSLRPACATRTLCCNSGRAPPLV